MFSLRTGGAGTMSASVAKIEASQSWNAQTSALSAATIFTPSADGLYRITVYASASSGSGGVTPHMAFTDDAGSQARQFDPSNVSFPVSYSMTVKAKASTNIQVSTTISGSPTYDFYAVVESL
jgi:hypothetical protein